MADHETSSSSPGSQRLTPDASSPSSFSAELTEALLNLAIDTEQSVAVSYFIQATKQPVSVAIETLEACQWDLVEAVSRFGEYVERNQEELDESSAPAIEPLRPRSSSSSPTVVQGEVPLYPATFTTATRCRELHQKVDKSTREVFDRLLRIRLRWSIFHQLRTQRLLLCSTLPTQRSYGILVS